MGRRTRLIAPPSKPAQAPVETVRLPVTTLVPALRMEAYRQAGGELTRIEVLSPTSFMLWNKPRDGGGWVRRLSDPFPT